MYQNRSCPKTLIKKLEPLKKKLEASSPIPTQFFYKGFSSQGLELGLACR